MDLSSNTRLQLNPNLIVWPHENLQYAFVNSDGVLGATFHLDANALEVLRAFAQPARVGEVFQPGNRTVFEILKAAIDGNFLVPPDSAATSAKHPKYAGFGLFDFADRDLRKHITRTIRLSGKSIFAIDGVLDVPEQLSCLRWMTQLPYYHHDVDTQESRRFRHWIKVFSPAADFASAFPIIALLARAGRECFRGSSLKVTRAHAYCISDGDVQFTHRDFQDLAGITVLYFANFAWDQNWGSEMLFYGRSGEAEVAVEPKPGRIIVFRGDLLHRAGVPSKIAEQPRYTLVVRLLGSAAAD